MGSSINTNTTVAPAPETPSGSEEHGETTSGQESQTATPAVPTEEAQIAAETSASDSTPVAEDDGFITQETKTAEPQRQSQSQSSSQNTASRRDQMSQEYEELYQQLNNPKANPNQLVDETMLPMVESFVDDMSADQYENQSAEKNNQKKESQKTTQDKLFELEHLSRGIKTLRSRVNSQKNLTGQEGKKEFKATQQENLKKLAQANQKLSQAKQRLLDKSARDNMGLWARMQSNAKAGQKSQFVPDEHLMTPEERAKYYADHKDAPPISGEGREMTAHELEQHDKMMKKRAKDLDKEVKKDQKTETKKEKVNAKETKKTGETKNTETEEVEDLEVQDVDVADADELADPDLNKYQMVLQSFVEAGKVTKEKAAELYAKKAASVMRHGALLCAAKDGAEEQGLITKIMGRFHYSEDEEDDSTSGESSTVETKEDKKLNFRQGMSKAFGSLFNGHLAEIAHQSTSSVFGKSTVADRNYEGVTEEGLKTYDELQSKGKRSHSDPDDARFTDGKGVWFKNLFGGWSKAGETPEQTGAQVRQRHGLRHDRF